MFNCIGICRIGVRLLSIILPPHYDILYFEEYKEKVNRRRYIRRNKDDFHTNYDYLCINTILIFILYLCNKSLKYLSFNVTSGKDSLTQIRQVRLRW